MARKVKALSSVKAPDPLIDGFLQAISAMRAASINTLSAYRQDLLDCQVGLAMQATTLANCDMDDLRALGGLVLCANLWDGQLKMVFGRITQLVGLTIRHFLHLSPKA